MVVALMDPTQSKTVVVRIWREDRAVLRGMKQHPRETIADTVRRMLDEHRLMVEAPR